MNYKSIADLNADTRRFAQSLPDVDLVVGIPRSGLLAANLLCLHLNVPMTDVDRLCEGRLIDSGERYTEDRPLRDFDSVLVLDDSVRSGSQMTETRDRLAEHEFPFDLSYGAMYILPHGREYVDHWEETVLMPRVFEWNVMHHSLLNSACVEIDGVLCRTPPLSEDDDEERYLQFLSTAEPTIVPDHRIGTLVTSRLEKHRPETEQWLDEHGIRYDDLRMMDPENREVRQGREDHTQYKSDIYDSTDASLFIEGNPRRAEEICQRTGRPVLCYETMEMLRPGRAKRTYREARWLTSSFRKNPMSFTKTAVKNLYYHAHRKISGK